MYTTYKYYTFGDQNFHITKYNILDNMTIVVQNNVTFFSNTKSFRYLQILHYIVISRNITFFSNITVSWNYVTFLANKKCILLTNSTYIFYLL